MGLEPELIWNYLLECPQNSGFAHMANHQRDICQDSSPLTVDLGLGERKMHNVE